MSGFPLKIVTPEGIRFDGTARMPDMRMLWLPWERGKLW